MCGEASVCRSSAGCYIALVIVRGIDLGEYKVVKGWDRSVNGGCVEKVHPTQHAFSQRLALASRGWVDLYR